MFNNFFDDDDEFGNFEAGKPPARIQAAVNGGPVGGLSLIHI